MTNSVSGDLHTVLRHLVSNIQWGGNQGEKAECIEALDRLTSNQDQSDDSDATDDPNAAGTQKGDPSVKDPDVSGGSRPTSARATAKPTR